MGFWSVVGRVIQGKPAFEVDDFVKNDDWDDDRPTEDFSEERMAKKEAAQHEAAAEERGLIDEHGRKQIPVAGVGRVKCHESGDNMEVWTIIENRSQRPIELDKMTLLGAKTELDHVLQPGGQYDFKVYAGGKMKHDSYKRAELYYKDVATGDYFRADHLIEYHYEASDKLYTIDDLRLLTPINDV